MTATPSLPGFKPRDLHDLTGTKAVVTGANSGIGLHTAAALADHGAEVVGTELELVAVGGLAVARRGHHPGVVDQQVE